MMENLDDDVVGLIFSKVSSPDDRKSISQVCKQWLRVEGLQRTSLRVFEPDLLPRFLPRFPNLLKFRACAAISNSSIQVLPTSCPRIRFLNLNYNDQGGDHLSEYEGHDDIVDESLIHIADGCRNLESVLLRRRSTIGDPGVVSLVGLSKNLRNLDLGFCTKVSDKSLKFIAGLNNLELLSLQGCYLISDTGLFYLAESVVRNTLKILNISQCDRITNRGLFNLRNMNALEELNLAECGPMVTDHGIGIGLGLSRSLKKLNLSWLVNVCDVALVSIAENCWSLEVLDLTGCEFVSGRGICAFSSHRCLKELVFMRCDNSISGDDLDVLVLGCSSLECIVLDRSLRLWIPLSVQENILRQNCMIVWK